MPRRPRSAAALYVLPPMAGAAAAWDNCAVGEVEVCTQTEDRRTAVTRVAMPVCGRSHATRSTSEEV
jgi:hypothetical protein